jgi:replicative DNA helicase
MTDESETRLPAQNLDAERGVLGACLLDHERIDDVATVLRVEDFYLPPHGFIFQAMLEMSRDNKRPDPTLLANYLKKKGQLSELADVHEVADAGEKNIAGRLFLDELSQCVPTAHNAVWYAKLVAEASQMRRLEMAGYEIVRVSRFDDMEPAERLAKAESEIFRVGELHAGKEAKHVGDVLSAAVASIEARQDREGLSGLSTGYADVDKLTGGLKNGELVILAGKPGMGKSAYATNVAHRTTMIGDIKASVLFVSLEMSEGELGERLLCTHGRIDGHKCRNGFLGEMERVKIREANNALAGAKLYIDATPGRSMPEISSLCRRHKRRHGLDLVIVDYLQIIAAEDRRAPREQQVAAIAQRLKNMARELDRPVLCLAQLNRQTDAARGNRPTLTHLRESGAIEQEADQVWFVHRDDYFLPAGEERERVKGTAELIVAKNRNGPTGEANLVWLDYCTRFESMCKNERTYDESDWPKHEEPGGNWWER